LPPLVSREVGNPKIAGAFGKQALRMVIKEGLK
jgi:hypothetical protein